MDKRSWGSGDSNSGDSNSNNQDSGNRDSKPAQFQEPQQQSPHHQLPEKSIVLPLDSNQNPEDSKLDRPGLVSLNQVNCGTPAEHDGSVRRPNRPPINSMDRTSNKRRQHRRPSGFATHFFWFLATVALFFAAWFLGPSLIERYQFAATRGKINAQYEHAFEALKSEPLTNVSRAYQLVAQKINPSVVSVNTEKIGENPDEEGFQRIAGEGSGVVLTHDGYILTNHHVVKNSKRIEIVLANRRVYSARVIGTDELTDLAVIKIDADDLFPAEWANSDEVEVGTLVWAVGNPYGLKQTITSGILSGKDRQGESSQYQEFLQTDAAVNPGNSGGPLVDSCGRVIGINTSIYGRRFQGISFAVPSVLAQYVYKEIREHGKVDRGFLGVTPGVVYQHHAEILDLADLDGALIRSVEHNTPAADAGMEAGDVIRSWDGQEVKNWRHLYRYVSMTKPNLCVPVELVRGGETRMLNVKVTESPQNPG